MCFPENKKLLKLYNTYHALLTYENHNRTYARDNPVECFSRILTLLYNTKLLNHRSSFLETQFHNCK